MLYIYANSLAIFAIILTPLIVHRYAANYSI